MMHKTRLIPTKIYLVIVERLKTIIDFFLNGDIKSVSFKKENLLSMINKIHYFVIFWSQL